MQEGLKGVNPPINFFVQHALGRDGPCVPGIAKDSLNKQKKY